MNKQYALPAGLERRKEDYKLITGRSSYVDDIRPEAGRPPTLHMAVVRSPYAHARIAAIHLEAARAVEGVVAVYTGRELVENLPTLPAFTRPDMQMKQPKRYPLAVDKVRYVGDPVAVVLAENPYAASDGRDLVDVDYEPLSAVVDPEQALEADAPVLYEELGDNIT